jgi:type III pantothenate kinase
MILEVDSGNTRIKWRLRQAVASGGYRTIAQDSVFALSKVPSVFINFGKQIESLPVEQVSRLLVSNVRGDGFRKVFTPIMLEKWHLQPEFAAVSDSECGVTCGYSDPARLGVDRWLAMLAAWQEVGTRCHIVDCGTTMTFDTIDENGKHLGGYIVPGLHLLRETLISRSKALAVEKQPWESTAPGTDTGAAIHNGILNMILGFLRDRKNIDDEGGQKAVWFMSGGDSSLIVPHLDWDCLHRPDLVLDGLEAAMLQKQA